MFSTADRPGLNQTKPKALSRRSCQLRSENAEAVPVSRSGHCEDPLQVAELPLKPLYFIRFTVFCPVLNSRLKRIATEGRSVNPSGGFLCKGVKPALRLRRRQGREII